jgi:hypothetical protein
MEATPRTAHRLALYPFFWGSRIASLELELTGKACAGQGFLERGTEKRTDGVEGYAELAVVVASWSGLSAPLRPAILAIAHAHTDSKEG